MKFALIWSLRKLKDLIMLWVFLFVFFQICLKMALGIIHSTTVWLLKSQTIRAQKVKMRLLKIFSYFSGTINVVHGSDPLFNPLLCVFFKGTLWLGLLCTTLHMTHGLESFCTWKISSSCRSFVVCLMKSFIAVLKVND